MEGEDALKSCLSTLTMKHEVTEALVLNPYLLRLVFQQDLVRVFVRA